MHSDIAWCCAAAEAYLCADPDIPRIENTALGVSEEIATVTAFAIASTSANAIAAASARPRLCSAGVGNKDVLFVGMCTLEFALWFEVDATEVQKGAGALPWYR